MKLLAKLALGLLLFPLQSAVSQKVDGKAFSPPGTIVDGEYTNDFFHMHYTLPSGWGKADAAPTTEKEAVHMMLNLRKGMQTVIMFGGDLKDDPKIKTAQDYLSGLKRDLEKDPSHPQWLYETRPVTYGKTVFYRQLIVYPHDRADVYEVFLVTITKGHALMVMFSSTTRDSVEKLVDSMSSMRFD